MLQAIATAARTCGDALQGEVLSRSGHPLAQVEEALDVGTTKSSGTA